MNSFNQKSTNLPKITIGMPVYNGEKFLQAKLDSLLTQTYSNFELLISDNGSTDSTSEICKDYAKKDKRVRYIQHNKNLGITWNFNFVLSEAKNEYFVFTAVDDVIAPNFLEETLKVLLENDNVSACISKIGTYDSIENISNFNDIDDKFKKLTKTLRQKTRPRRTISIKGTYEEKVRTYLRRSTCQVIYSLFRTEEICKTRFESFIGNDWAVFLDVLKYGDLHVIDRVLMYEYESGTTGGGILDTMKNYNQKFFGSLFPWFPLISWCQKNLGMKIFLKNIDYFIQLNLEGGFSVLIDLFRRVTHGLSRR